MTHPHADPAIATWLARLRRTGSTVRVSEIADDDVRRELLRANRTVGIDRLDALGALLGYLPVTRDVLQRASALWAEARRQGRPTSSDAALDGDVIIAAQAQLATIGCDRVIVATGNVRHLGRFTDAREWQDIR